MRRTDGGGVRRSVLRSIRGLGGRAGPGGHLLGDPRVRLLVGAGFLFVAAVLPLLAPKPAGGAAAGTVGSSQPFYSEWSPSGAAGALVNLRGSPVATDTCLQCHSADYILESEPSLRPTIDRKSTRLNSSHGYT